ncbi:hypothetical protein MNBD_PLANCTO02-1864 [hydrothermal vent metagenome]|uniref:Swt1-like HEPN domain-containing protein n=1 Tax=hydrothermal vent metagenome TaxID=652676 RepID=A0A3B1DFR7_9ZZZZ
MQINRQYIYNALELLTAGLFPYVEQGLKKVYRNKWHDEALSSFRDDHKIAAPTKSVIKWDAHNLLTVMWDQWNRVFRQSLRQSERSLVVELREFRNRWAHQDSFDFDDTYRMLDSTERLLKAIGAEGVAELQTLKQNIMREKITRDVRNAYRKTQLRKQKIKDLSIYWVSCLSIVGSVIYMMMNNNWFVLGWGFLLFPLFFITFVIVFFVYLTYERLKTPSQLFHGPHECYSCGKIIYTEDCPYCETSPEENQTIDMTDSQAMQLVEPNKKQKSSQQKSPAQPR